MPDHDHEVKADNANEDNANEDNANDDNANAIKEDVADAKEFFVYLLESSCKKATYVGATVNLERRLRQHNKELAGGAHATGARVARGETWRRACHVTGFPTWQAALQFEWRFKQLTRRERSDANQTPLERRQAALKRLLALPQSTSKAVPFAEWPSGGPVIIWE
jgi:predicted GIY-YIG superfamily endonuclease